MNQIILPPTIQFTRFVIDGFMEENGLASLSQKGYQVPPIQKLPKKFEIFLYTESFQVPPEKKITPHPPLPPHHPGMGAWGVQTMHMPELFFNNAADIQPGECNEEKLYPGVTLKQIPKINEKQGTGKIHRYGTNKTRNTESVSNHER